MTRRARRPHAAAAPAASPTPAAIRVWEIAAIAALTFAIFSPAWHGGPLWDDEKHLTEPALRSFAGLWRIWLDPGATQQYYPVTHSAFWLMHRLWGDITTGYHLVNIALHAISACLVVVILRRLAIPGALVAGALFAVHPVHVESVAWMTELKNTLSGACYLAAALSYLRFGRTGDQGAWVTSLLWFLLALGSKTVTATLPAALLVIVWWQRGRLEWRRDVRPLLPFFVIGVTAGLVTAYVERTLIGASGDEYAFSAAERVLIAGRALWFYAVSLVWPLNLSFIYPRWTIDTAHGLQWLYPAAAGLAVGVCWWLRQRTRAPLAAVLFFAGTLFPALGFFNVYPFRFSFVADHFQYLASLGVIAGITAGVTHAATQARWPRRVRAILAVAVITSLALLAWRESGQYRDAVTLYRSTLARNPAAWIAHVNLGRIELDTAPASALSRFEAALALRPDLVEARSNLGNALQRLGRHEDAIPHYRQALERDPDNAVIWSHLSSGLRQIGRFDESAAAARRAIDLAPDFAEAHFNLGETLRLAGSLAEAAAALRDAVRLHPDSSATRYSLGMTLFRSGSTAEALPHLEASVRLLPTFAQGYSDLAVALVALGRDADAMRQLALAIRAQPDFADAYFNLGILLRRSGRLQEAAESYRRAVALRPDDATARQHLQAVLDAIGREGSRGPINREP